MCADRELKHPFDFFPREKLVLLACGFAFLAWLAWVAYSKSSRPEAPLSREAAADRLDINEATAAELEELPLIGPSRAAGIVEYRASEGRFHSIDDLKRVRDISDKVVEVIRPHVMIGKGE